MQTRLLVYVFLKEQFFLVLLERSIENLQYLWTSSRCGDVNWHRFPASRLRERRCFVLENEKFDQGQYIFFRETLFVQVRSRREDV